MLEILSHLFVYNLINHSNSDSMIDYMKARYMDFINEGVGSFDDIAIEFFHFQRQHNEVYKHFLRLLNHDFSRIRTIFEIPFMPVSFFKNSEIKTGKWVEEIVFESSSTTGNIPSRHFVNDLSFYKKNAEFCFNYFFGDLSDYCIFALLPSYLERESSSLIHMTDHFIKRSKCGNFYKNDFDRLYRDLSEYGGNKKIILLGVTFALLEFVYKNSIRREIMVMETGGMKGRGPELPREAVHEKLLSAFNIAKIFSEYGMTELMSQAYSKGDGIFYPAPSMKIMISDIYDPFTFLPNNRQGKINIIDLANFHSCCFLATDDLGISPDGIHFKVLGRTDESDIRGCNLLNFN